MIIIDWKTDCCLDESNTKHYSNKIFISLNYDLFFDFDIGRPDCNTSNSLRSKENLSVWNLDLDTVNLNVLDMNALAKLSEKVGLSTDLLFDLISLCFHSFMFDPQSQEHQYNITLVPDSIDKYQSRGPSKNINLNEHLPNQYENECNKLNLEKFGYYRCNMDNFNFRSLLATHDIIIKID